MARPRPGHGAHRGHRRDGAHPRRDDDPVRVREHVDRVRRLPAAAGGAAARRPDHRGRDVLHRPERLARALRRELPVDPELHPAHRGVLDRRHQLLLEQARRGRDHAARARAPLVVRLFDEAGEGDAGRRAGQGGLGDDGYRRESDDLDHVRDRRGARRRRGDRLPAPVQHAVRHRLRARPDRFHGRRARGDREPVRRRARLARDRLHPGVQRGSDLEHARQRLDALDRLRDPDRDPRLPSGGSARRADAGGGVGTDGRPAAEPRLRGPGEALRPADRGTRPHRLLPELRLDRSAISPCWATSCRPSTRW